MLLYRNDPPSPALLFEISNTHTPEKFVWVWAFNGVAKNMIERDRDDIKINFFTDLEIVQSFM
jgi:hypothetical protein